MNIDGSRIATTDNLAGGTYGGTFGAERDENSKLPKAIGSGDKGRWPANVILDELSAGFVDQQSGVSTSGAAGKNASSGFPGGGYDGDYSVPYGDTGGASRFFYVAKASKRDRAEGLDFDNSHPTVKPTALMRYLIKLVTPAGGVVLDPFTGSGSTGKAALLDGYEFVGAELTEEYLPIIEARLRWASEQMDTDDTLF
jgi:site-specific DNA-methyltransferase (adenine-specific)